MERLFHRRWAAITVALHEECDQQAVGCELDSEDEKEIRDTNYGIVIF